TLTPQSSVYAFTPGVDTAWRTFASLPAARANLAATTGSDGTLYAIGGYDGSGIQSTVYAFTPGVDTAARTFTSLPAAPAALAATPGSDGTVYAIGGWDSSGAPQSTVNAYIPAAVAPAITSADHTTFTVGAAGSFSVTATGSPTPMLSKTGALPAG